MAIDPFAGANDQGSLFDDSSFIDPDKDYYTELVGEGKKYKDEKALARANAEKEAFIQRLTSETARMREELRTRKTVEELMTKLPTPRSDNQQTPPVVDPELPLQTKTYTPEDIEQLLEQSLAKREQKSQATRNLEEVTAKLAESFGEDARHIVATRAQELGVSANYLKQLATEQPKAFLRLVGADTPKQEDIFSGVPRNQVETARLGNLGKNEKTYKYYQKLRKENPNEYNKPAIQNEMFEQARKLGDNFYS